MASPDFVTSQRMSAGVHVEILLYEEMFQGFSCGGLFCFQSRNLNSISVSNVLGHILSDLVQKTTAFNLD